jgi:two-component system sensor kinase
MSEHPCFENQVTGPFEVLLRKSGDGIVIVDHQGIICFVNPAAAEIFGRAEEELVGTDLGFPLANGDKTEVEVINRHEGLKTVQMIATETVWYDKPVYLAMFHDITRQIEAEEKYRLLAENTSDLIVVLEGDEVVFISPSVETILGYTVEEFTRLGHLDVVHPEDREAIAEEISEHLQRRPEGRLRYLSRQRHADGTYRWIETAAVKRVVESGRTITVLNSRDVSERVSAQEQLQAALEEKTYLMKELNHRIKNNLALVTSLIGTKDAALGEEVDLSDLKSRIEAIRIVHDRLFHTEEVRRIDLRGYLEDLLATIFSSMTRRDVKLETNIEPVSIETKTAIPLGLIVNEVATNAIKHGFAADMEARFNVVLSSAANGDGYVLMLANSGRPFPEDVDLNNTESLGLKLVPLLADQIGGTVDLDREPSARFTVRFPKSAG